MPVNPRIDGKVALVTGASRGIGRAIAQRLASAGATVIVTGRSNTTPAAGKRYGQEFVLTGTLAETVGKGGLPRRAPPAWSHSAISPSGV